MVLDLAVPGLILLVKASVKAYVNQRPGPVDLFRTLLALPVDIAFIGASFAFGILLSGPGRDDYLILSVVMLGLVFIAIIASTLWRHCEDWLSQGKRARLILAMTVNYFVSVFAVLSATSLLGNG